MKLTEMQTVYTFEMTHWDLVYLRRAIDNEMHRDDALLDPGWVKILQSLLDELGAAI